MDSEPYVDGAAVTNDLIDDFDEIPDGEDAK